MVTMKIETVALVINMMAHVATVWVAGFAVLQFQHNQALERQATAVESVARLRTKEVVEAMVRLETHYDADDLSYDGVAVDAAQVVSWYDYVAMLYVSGAIVDRCIVKGAIEPHLTLVQNVMNELRYSPGRRVNIDLLANRISDETCHFTTA